MRRHDRLHVAAVRRAATAHEARQPLRRQLLRFVEQIEAFGRCDGFRTGEERFAVALRIQRRRT
jgi:hypothetical protein